MNFKDMPLGKRAPRIDPRTLKLSAYRTRILGLKSGCQPSIHVPDAETYVDRVKRWPMYLNDELGDCVAAAAGHCINQWTAYAGRPCTPRDSEILEFYETQGYKPGDPETDNGMVMLYALNYWRKYGVANHKISAYVAVNPNNTAEVEEAIYLFGNLYLGLQLPLTAQGSDVWDVDPKVGTTGDGSPGSWGGHCVPVLGYCDPKARTPGQDPGFKLVTWGSVIRMTWDFLHAYCDEAYAMVSEDWISSTTGISESGFNLKQLMQDIQALA